MVSVVLVGEKGSLNEGGGFGIEIWLGRGVAFSRGVDWIDECAVA